MAATDQQIQNYIDTRIRPHSEVARHLTVVYDDDISSIDDVYNALVDPGTWVDNRSDSPPHYLSPADILAINSFMHDIRDAIKAHSAYPIIIKACVRNVV